MSLLAPRAAGVQSVGESDRSGTALSGSPPPTGRTELLKRAAIALSIANLCFLFVWGAILHIATERTIAYFLQRPPDRGFFWAVLLDVIVLGTVTFLLLTLGRSGPWALRFSLTALLALICLFALYQCERSFNGMLYGVVSARVILGLRIIIAIAIVLFIVRSPKRTLPRLRTFFLVVSPLFLVFAAQGLWAYYGPLSRQFQPAHVAGMLPASASHTRVIWIIFDELDYRLLFPARPARVQLPHFDALRDTSVFADHVKSPAPNTLSAIPSLLLSKDIPDNEEVKLNSRPVQVRFNGCSQFVAINSEPNVFRRARDLGFNTAVAGWYHPYCRLFGNDLSACAATSGAETGISILEELLRDRGFLAKAAYLANWQARVLPLEQRLAWVSPMPSEDVYLRQVITDKLRRVLHAQAPMLKNPDLDFVFLHIPSPHPPGIWDTRRQAFATDSGLDYIDNLELADHILGRIRRLLGRTGDWNRSTILVSSDHPYRPDHWLTVRALPVPAEMHRLTHMRWQPYIPFLLKLPGQKTGIEYHRPFNSVLSANLLLAALQGQIRTPAQAVQWLDAHAAASEEKVCR